MERQLKEESCLNFMAISEALISLNSEDGGDDDENIAVFYVARHLFELLNRHPAEVMTELMQMYHRQLASGSATNKLYRYDCGLVL